jgi:hypothetical protein
MKGGLNFTLFFPQYLIIIIIMGSSYYSAFHNVSMRFAISGGLFWAAYYGAIGRSPSTLI